MSQDIVIVNYARTPIGAFQGCLKSIPAPSLGGSAIAKCFSSSKLAAEDIDATIMGCVLSAGLGQAPARQAALAAGLSQSTDAATVNKMCASGLKAITLAYEQLLAGTYQAIIAGGMESMTNAPYLLPNVRHGLRMGHNHVQDHMFLDGLEDAYDKGKLMGVFAENTAAKFNISRQMQDEFAIASLEKAKKATADNLFTNEITPVEVKSRKETKTISQDEVPTLAKIDKIPNLPPAFKKPDGTVTAANSSSIADGAAAVLLTTSQFAKKHGLKPIAKILGYANHSHEPEWFTTAPIGSLNNLVKKTGIKLDKVDLFEINEAFAVVTLAAVQELKLDVAKVNVYGGACALGHPIGASGARVICTLLNALEQQDKKLGVASLCIGGGEAMALALERIT